LLSWVALDMGFTNEENELLADYCVHLRQKIDYHSQTSPAC
jgi:hypothetical protein